MAHAGKCLSPDLSLGHDLMVREIEPCIGLCADSMEPAWDSLPFFASPPLPPPAPHALSLSLSI